MLFYLKSIFQKNTFKILSFYYWRYDNYLILAEGGLETNWLIDEYDSQGLPYSYQQ